MQCVHEHLHIYNKITAEHDTDKQNQTKGSERAEQPFITARGVTAPSETLRISDKASAFPKRT